MNCSNCNTQINCSCQLRTATDGKQVCSHCISAYEDQIKATKVKLADLNNIKLKNFTT